MRPLVTSTSHIIQYAARVSFSFKSRVCVCKAGSALKELWAAVWYGPLPFQESQPEEGWAERGWGGGRGGGSWCGGYLMRAF